MYLSFSSKNEFKAIISSLNPNKSVGPNSTPIGILKLIKDEISLHLAGIYNISFSSSLFPIILKIAKVIPIRQKDSKLDYSNYRPGSLLSKFEEILERLIENRLFKFLDKNSLIYPLQFGFCQNTPMNHNLINFTETLNKDLDKGKVVVGILLDLQNAIDTVDHNLLLSELDHYGIQSLTN